MKMKWFQAKATPRSPTAAQQQTVGLIERRLAATRQLASVGGLPGLFDEVERLEGLASATDAAIAVRSGSGSAATRPAPQFIRATGVAASVAAPVAQPAARSAVPPAPLSRAALDPMEARLGAIARDIAALQADTDRLTGKRHADLLAMTPLGQRALARKKGLGQ